MLCVLRHLDPVSVSDNPPAQVWSACVESFLGDVIRDGHQKTFITRRCPFSERPLAFVFSVLEPLFFFFFSIPSSLSLSECDTNCHLLPAAPSNFLLPDCLLGTSELLD